MEELITALERLFKEVKAMNEMIHRIYTNVEVLTTRLDEMDKRMGVRFDGLDKRVGDLWKVVVAILVGVFAILGGIIIPLL
jgi:predicted nuclease with TOPRIM domain